MQATHINHFTKEAIKARMLQNAASLWNIKNPLALDPFVRLLIEAFSTEIYHAVNTTQLSEGRLLEKIAKLLTPELLVMPKAAHGIMQAKPIESKQILNSLTHFYTQKRISSQGDGMLDTAVDLLFTPVDHVALTHGKISHTAVGRQLFSVDDTGNKFPIQRTTKPLPWATAYIGLELHQDVENLENIALYFDFAAYQTQPWIYQLLPLAKIAINENVLIKKQHGLIYHSQKTKNVEESIYQDYDTMHAFLQSIKTLYDYKFLTLHQCDIKSIDKTYVPQALIESFSHKTMQEKIKDSLLWLQIQFPANYTYDILENMYVAINAFPVVNCILKDNSYNYRALNNILPLNTDTHQHFMTVHSVTDGQNRSLSEIPFKRVGTQNKGYYSMRSGGVERFDQRSAQDMIKYLMELAQDEIAAFGAINQDFIVQVLEEISKQLVLLETRIEKIENFVHQVPTYLIVEPYDDENQLYVEYWVTQCELANQLRTGTAFLAQNNADILPASIVLLSNTFGGKEKPQPGDRLDAYRYALGSRDRLITMEDIRNFCQYELGNKIKQINFQKGLTLSAHPKQGYIRTLDIKIVPHHYNELKPEEWDYLAHNLYIKIKTKSADGIHYQVIIENESATSIQ